MKDLFGQDIPDPKLRAHVPLTQEEAMRRKLEKRRQYERARGYAGTPGQGPAGQTCQTCKHAVGVEHAKVYWKCLLMRHKWTGGPKTDIRLRTAACEKWEKENDQHTP